MANSFRHERLEDLEVIEQHIMSYAERFGANDIAGYDEKLKQWFPTKKMELAMHELIDEYNDDYFYEELVQQLARWDVLRKFGDGFEGMTIREKVKIEQPFLDGYYDEIEKNGLENIGIIDDDGMRDSERKISIN